LQTRQTLRALERSGFLTRTVDPTTPPSVEYAWTRLGTSVLELADDLRVWAERHVWEVVSARARFDRNAAAAAPAVASGRRPPRAPGGVSP
jgi:DNA-binding HxlR family transcriptional regulator